MAGKWEEGFTVLVLGCPYREGIYLLTRQGIYWHELYSDSVDRIVDGGLCSIGDTERAFTGMALLETEGEPEFLVLYDGKELMRYVYDAGIPSVPDALRVYSVYEDNQIVIAVSTFRRLHPDIPIVYEAGMNASYGATVDDVLKNLATEIAAGNGPDILVISLGLALIINGSPGRDRCKYLYLLPMAVPAATMVLVWKMLFEKQGFLNRHLGSYVDFLKEDSAFYILVGSYLWKNLGYTLVLWLAGLRFVPGDMLDAARVDGAGRAVCFFRVTLPNLKGSMYTILVVSILNSFKIFREVYLVGGAYPQESIYLLQHIFNNWYVNLDFDKMAAGAVLSVLVLGSICLLLRRLWDKDVQGEETKHSNKAFFRKALFGRYQWDMTV